MLFRMGRTPLELAATRSGTRHAAKTLLLSTAVAQTADRPSFVSFMPGKGGLLSRRLSMRLYTSLFLRTSFSSFRRCPITPLAL